MPDRKYYTGPPLAPWDPPDWLKGILRWNNPALGEITHGGARGQTPSTGLDPKQRKNWQDLIDSGLLEKTQENYDQSAFGTDLDLAYQPPESFAVPGDDEVLRDFARRPRQPPIAEDRIPTAGGTFDADPEYLVGPDAAGAIQAIYGRMRGVDKDSAPPTGDERIARRRTADYGPAIEQALRGEVDPNAGSRALARFGAAMLGTRGNFFKAFGKGAIAAIDSMDQAEERARARQAQAIGYGIHDATLAETERRDLESEQETRRAHRAAEGTARGHLEIAQQNSETATRRFGLELTKYQDGKGDLRALTLARIAKLEADDVATRARAMYLMRPDLVTSDTGDQYVLDRYGHRPTAQPVVGPDGKPFRGAITGKQGVRKTKAELLVEYGKEAGWDDSRIADALSGVKQIGEKDIEAMVEKRVGNQVIPGTITQSAIDQIRKTARTEIEQTLGRGGAKAPAGGAVYTPTQPARPTTRDEAEKLPAGTPYINPSDGKLYTRK